MIAFYLVLVFISPLLFAGTAKAAEDSEKAVTGPSKSRMACAHVGSV